MSTTLSPQKRSKKRCLDLGSYSVVEVAARADVPRSTLYEYLYGKPKHILHDHLLNLAQFLGCSPDALAAQYASRREGHLVELQYDKQLHSDLWLGDTDMSDIILSRRAFNRGVIQSFFALPSMALLLSSLDIDATIWEQLKQSVQAPHRLDEDTLIRFERLITKCWELSDGSELGKVEQILSTFLTPMAALARQTFIYQHRVASIASQGYQLMYVVSSHEEDFKTALSHVKQARLYAQIAGDVNLEAASLIRQGVTHLHRKSPHDTLLAYQEALPLVGNLSPLLKSRLYADLCEVQGKLQQEQEARYSIGLAMEYFPEDPVLDPAARYIHFSRSSIPLHEGLALLDLHQPGGATAVFAKIDSSQLSLRSQIDVLNQLGYAAIALDDIERVKLSLEAAVPTALKLGSDLRRSESWDVYTRAFARWPQEQQVKNLSNLFQKRV